MTPADEEKMMTTRIAITWPPVPGATGYTIQNGPTKVQSAKPTVHGLAVKR